MPGILVTSMYCSKCGSPNTNDARFCAACGQAIGPAAQANPGVTPPPPAPPQPAFAAGTAPAPQPPPPPTAYYPQQPMVAQQPPPAAYYPQQPMVAQPGQPQYQDPRVRYSAGVPAAPGAGQYAIGKSAGLAVFLSFLIPGMGQFYCGSNKKGGIMLGIYLFSWILLFVYIGSLTILGVWIWSMIDAYNTASGKTPLS